MFFPVAGHDASQNQHVWVGRKRPSRHQSLISAAPSLVFTHLLSISGSIHRSRDGHPSQPCVFEEGNVSFSVRGGGSPVSTAVRSIDLGPRSSGEGTSSSGSTNRGTGTSYLSGCNHGGVTREHTPYTDIVVPPQVRYNWIFLAPTPDMRK